jgi:hypothetical protein
MRRPVGFTRRTFAALAALAYAHPYLVLVLALASAVASVVHAQRALRIETSRNALIGDDHPYQRQYQAYRQAFTKTDDLAIVVTGDDARAAEEFVVAVGRALERRRDLFESVTYRIDTSSLSSKALLYLDERELRSLRQRLETNQDLLNEVVRHPELARLLRLVSERMSQAVVAHALSGLLGDDEDADTGAVSPAFVNALVGSLRDSLVDPRRYRSPWPRAFFDKDDPGDELFLKSEGGRFWFVLAQPRSRGSDLASSQAVLRVVREQIEMQRGRHPGLEAGVTGMFALAAEETAASQSDNTLAAILALVAVFALFVVVFRAVSGPLMATLALVVAMMWTLGFATLTVGHLTVLSMAIAAILVGLGIDFGVHVVFRVQEEAGEVTRSHESTNGDGNAQHFQPILAAALTKAGPAVLAGALTTALSFFAVVFTDFKGLAEVGWIAGSGVLLALVSAFTVLPALLVIQARWHRRHHAIAPRRGGWLRPRLDLLDRRRAWVLVLGLAVTVVLGLGLRRLRFDANLLHLQARGTPSVLWEEKLLAETDRSIWYAVSLSRELNELRTKVAAFEALPSVGDVRSVLDLLPSDSDARIPKIEAMRPLLPDRGLRGAPTGDPDLAEVRKSLRAMRFKLGNESNDVHLDQARRYVDESLALIARGPVATVQARLAAFERQLFSDLFVELDRFAARLTPTPVTLQDLPRAIASQFVSPQGTFLAQLYARDYIWDQQPLARFVGDLRRVDPLVTGSPVQTLEASRAMRQGYEQGGIYALAAICVVLLVQFRAPRPALLALAPLLCGAIWTFGLMGWLGIDLNLANLVVLPLLVGLSIDSGIHIVERHREEGGGGFALLGTSTLRAVALATLTNIAGFASLLIARHRGIQSIGVVLTLGLTMMLVACFVVLPALLTPRERV